MGRKKQMYIAGLDLGSHAIKVVQARLDNEERIEIVGIGESQSHGIYLGIIRDMSLAVDSVNAALTDAENMSGHKADELLIGINGMHITSGIGNGSIKIPSGTVTEDDINTLLESAASIDVGSNQVIIHNLPQYYVIDKREETPTRTPYGLSGSKIDVSTCVITVAKNVYKDITRCLEYTETNIPSINSNLIASSELLIDEDQRNLGICLVDFGSALTSIAIFSQGALRYISSTEIAGNHVTRDLAIALKIPTAEAEKIKVTYSHITRKQLTHEDEIELSNGSVVKVPYVIDIIEQRYKDIFEVIQTKVNRSGYSDIIGRGLVCIGGGSQYAMLQEMIHEIFELPSMVNIPITNERLVNHELTTPVLYTSALGLLLLGLEIIYPKAESNTINQNKGFLKNILSWI